MKIIHASFRVESTRQIKRNDFVVWGEGVQEVYFDSFDSCIDSIRLSVGRYEGKMTVERWNTGKSNDKV